MGDRLLVALACAGMAACFAVLFVVARAGERESLRRQVDALAREKIDLLRSRIERSTEVLHGITSLFDVQGEVPRGQFHDFVTPALRRQPELQALEWIPRVPSADRTAIEEQARRQGNPAFAITEQTADGLLITAGARAQHFPVYYLEPLAGNQVALGFDLASDPTRAWAMEQARDSRQLTATPPIRLAQELDQQLGFLVFAPVYAGTPAPDTVAERRARLRGFALAAFRMGDLVGAALENLAARGLNVRMVDGASGALLIEARPGLPLRHGTLREPAAPLPPADAAAATGTIDVAGWHWSVLVSPAVAFRAAEERHLSYGVLPLGLLFTLLLGAFVSRELRHTAVLAHSNQILQEEIAVRARAQTEAAAANEAKSIFLGNVSHELRTPLNAVLGYTQILEREKGLPLSCRNAVETIGIGARHLLGLANELLDLTKIEAGHVEVRQTDFDLTSLLSELAVLFKIRCHDKRLTFDLVGAPRDRLLVRGDPGLLRQALVNLTSNAIKFTETGSIAVRTTLDPDGRRRFEIVDTGIGIPAHRHADVFKAFHQIPGRRRGGAGLGLTIARANVGLLGGELALTSAPGQGSTFSFSIPLPAISRALDAGSAPAAPQPEQTRRVRRLAPGCAVHALVVDDVAENRDVLSWMLTDLGCTVTAAARGDEALALALSRGDGTPGAPAPLSVAFIDLQLPDIDGLALGAALRAQASPGPRLVAYSASVHQAGEATRAGFEWFLSKPVSYQTVADCLASVGAAAGVRLVDVPEPPAQRDDDTQGTDIMAGATAAELSPALRDRLAAAARVHNATELRVCLRELLQQTGARRPPAWLSQLERAVRAYDMRAVLAVVEPRAA